MPSDRPLAFDLGVKTDPIQYRHGYDWLFDLMADEGVRHAQLGTFFELYQLPDEWFADLRRRADDRGVTISSVFTAHRELGGFFRDDGPGWEGVARRNFERLIDVAGLVGARRVGSNPGAVLRESMDRKAAGTAVYLRHFKELMGRAKDRGVEWLSIEPMSCLAEPPTLPEEMREMAEELSAYRESRRDSTARPGYCVDVAHGYADATGRVVHDHFALMGAAVPWTCEVHLKNTDRRYDSTFGFNPPERERGIIDAAACRAFYADRASDLPVDTLVGYLEVGGPKLGRDYSDPKLGDLLRGSLRHLKEAWLNPPAEKAADDADLSVVSILPSMMCADLCNLAGHLAELERHGAAHLLHLDVMDNAFVPNLTLGPDLIRRLRGLTSVPLDAHLMVADNDRLAAELVGLGVDRVSVHAESATHLDRTLNLIRAGGAKAGVAINPATPLDALEYVLESVDFVVLMTVNPGYAGQPLFAGALRKIADCRRMLDASADRLGRRIPIQVDGNVSFENIPKMVAAGADELVGGTSSIFHKGGTLSENMARIRAAVADGLSRRSNA